MEAYKTTCPDCGHIRFWVGYKTGLGKTSEQLAQMKKDATTCRSCRSTNTKTELDHESETGKMLDEQLSFLTDILKEAMERKEKKKTDTTTYK